MGVRLAVANSKGGVGKTTTAVNLAGAWAALGTRVLVVDLDPQADSSRWLGSPSDGRELLQVLIAQTSLAQIVRPSGSPSLEVVPGGPYIDQAETRLHGIDGRETILRKALKQLPGDAYEAIVIDCPPRRGLFTLMALTAADKVVIPVEPATFSLTGLAALAQLIEAVKERLNPALEVGAIVPWRVENTLVAREVLALLRQRFGGLVTETVIRKNTALVEAAGNSRPIVQYAPRSAGAEDYRNLAAELATRFGSKVLAHV